MRAGMYSLRVRRLCRSWRLLGSLWGLAGAPGRLEAVAPARRVPPAVTRLAVYRGSQVANVAPRDKQEIGDLGTLIETKLRNINILKTLWKQKSLQFFTLFQMVLTSSPGKICKSSKK